MEHAPAESPIAREQTGEGKDARVIEQMARARARPFEELKQREGGDQDRRDHQHRL
jgi:hypothetical protein